MTTILKPQSGVKNLLSLGMPSLLMLTCLGLSAQTTHYLIVGSHTQLSQAKKHQTTLLNQGYEDARILYPVPSTKNYRVSIRSSESKATLSSYAQSLPGRMPHWVLKLDQPAETYYFPSATDPNYRSQEPPSDPEVKVETTYFLIIHSDENY